MEKKENKKSSSSVGGVVFAGCMFLGAGTGMLFNEMEIGGALGMGVGFISMGAIWAYYKNSEQ